MAELVEADVTERIRTTQPRHHRASQAIWDRMQAAGDIYLSKYPGWYSVRDEAFFDESELIVASDGSKRAPGGAPVEWVEEESYYFKLSAYCRASAGALQGAPRIHRPGEISQRSHRVLRARV